MNKNKQPSPEMVCPQCEGVGHWLLASMGTAKVCPKCNGTGKVPSPEPPEKVRETLALERWIELTGEIQGDWTWEQAKTNAPMSTKSVQQERDWWILKLQQAGWVDGSKTYCVYCGTEFKVDDAAGTKVTEHIKTCTKHPLYQALARIKELEKQNEQLRIGELVITTEQKQKEQIIAIVKAQLQAVLRELE